MSNSKKNWFPNQIPIDGAGDHQVRALMDSLLNSASAPLSDPTTFSHMDPPASEIAAYIVGRNAEVNQNLLHADLSPLASEAERCVISWLCPYFQMSDGFI